MLFWNKERQVESDIASYLEQNELTVATFHEAMRVLFAEGPGAHFEQLVEQTHQYETAADDQRRVIEHAMYSRALIPESRGDMLGMLEALDLVPNKCESVLFQIWTQHMVLPAAWVDDLVDMVRTNVQAHAELCKAVRSLFADAKKVSTHTRAVTALEAASDAIERRIIRAIFQSELDKADRILLKELVLEIGAISDRAENAADRVSIIAVKRHS